MITEFSNRLKRIEKMLEEKQQNDVIFLNIEEVSAFLRMQKSSIYQLVFHKKIPHYKQGKKLLFKKSEIVDWVNSRRVSSAEELASRLNLEKIVFRNKTKDKPKWIKTA